MDVYLLKQRWKKAAKQVQGIDWGAVFLFLIVAAAVFWFVSNKADPASLVLTFVSLDSFEPVNSVHVEVFDDAGRLFASEWTQGQTIVLTELPSGKTLRVVAEAGNNFKTQSVFIDLASGEHAVRQIELASSRSVSLSKGTLPSSIGRGCVVSFNVKTVNQGSEKTVVELVPEGDLQGMVFASKVEVPAGSEVSIPVELSLDSDYREDSLSGSLRVRGLQERVSVSLAVSDASRISVTPSAFKPSLDAGGEYKERIDLANSGKAVISRGELTLHFNGEITDWISYSFMEPGFSELKRGDRQSLVFSLLVPDNTPEGKYYGQAVFETGCGMDLVDFTVTVR
ncbi:MAG: hypothetical protein V1834_04825 [Candidatus Micrarchaeota archaeon]